MYNDFVIVGPAKIRRVWPSYTMQPRGCRPSRIKARPLSPAVTSPVPTSRKTLWQAADVKPEFAGYKSIGQGMGPTLTMASELGAYTLTDRGTWLAYQSKLDLAVLLEGDKRLFNPYQVILVNPKRYPDLNTEGARTLKNWLVSEHGQKLIGDFKVAGQALFVADANGK